MKKFLFMYLVLILVTSCGTLKTNNITKIENLSNDAMFIEYINNSLSLTKVIKNEKLFNEIYSDNIINDAELLVFSKILGFKTFDDYKKFTVKQENKLLFLSNKYNFKQYNSNELQKILIKEINDINDNDFTGLINPCLDKYRNTLKLNAAMAVGAHFACLSLDVTIVGGIICHGAAVAGQYYANQNALIDYRNCK